RMPCAVSTASTRSPTSRLRRSAISLGRVAPTDPPTWRSFSSRTMSPSLNGSHQSSTIVLLEQPARPPLRPVQATARRPRRLTFPLGILQILKRSCRVVPLDLAVFGGTRTISRQRHPKLEQTVAETYYLKLLGFPELRRPDGRPVKLKERKHLALLI